MARIPEGFAKTVGPNGARRRLQAKVQNGAGSNLVAFTYFFSLLPSVDTLGRTSLDVGKAAQPIGLRRTRYPQRSKAWAPATQLPARLVCTTANAQLSQWTSQDNTETAWPNGVRRCFTLQSAMARCPIPLALPPMLSPHCRV